MQPGEISLGSWIVGLIGRGPGVSGTLTVTDRRILFKPKVAGTSLATMLISQLPTFKDRYTIVIGKSQIVSVQCDKGMINTHIIVTTADGAIHVFNRGIVSADPVLAAIAQGQ